MPKTAPCSSSPQGATIPHRRPASSRSPTPPKCEPEGGLRDAIRSTHPRAQRRKTPFPIPSEQTRWMESRREQAVDQYQRRGGEREDALRFDGVKVNAFDGSGTWYLERRQRLHARHGEESLSDTVVAGVCEGDRGDAGPALQDVRRSVGDLGGGCLLHPALADNRPDPVLHTAHRVAGEAQIFPHPGESERRHPLMLVAGGWVPGRLLRANGVPRGLFTRPQ